MGIVEGALLFVGAIILITVPVALILVFSARLVPERVRATWRERFEGTGPLVIVGVTILAGYALFEAGCQQSTPSLHEEGEELPFFESEPDSDADTGAGNGPLR